MSSPLSVLTPRVSAAIVAAYGAEYAGTDPVLRPSHCPVLKAAPEVRSSRLSLCALTLEVLVQGLDLLGIEAPEQM